MLRWGDEGRQAGKADAAPEGRSVGELVESATRHRDAVEVRRKLEVAQDMQQQLVRQCVEQKTYTAPFFMRHLRDQQRVAGKGER